MSPLRVMTPPSSPHRLRGALVRGLSLAALLGASLGCTTVEEERAEERFQLSLSLAPVALELRLPGGWFPLVTEGQLSDAESALTLNVAETSYELELRRDERGAFQAQLPEALRARPPGPLSGELIFRQRLDAAQGEARASLQMTLAHTLAPRWGGALPAELHLATPSPLNADALLLEGEGESILQLRGTFTLTEGVPSPVDLELPLQLGERRAQASIILSPGIFGIQPGRFEGEGLLINRSLVGEERGPPQPISFNLIGPRINAVNPPTVSRGQRLFVSGAGFLGVNEGGFSILELEGEFIPLDGAEAPLAISRDLGLDAATPTRLTTSLTVTYDQRCESNDLGGRAGTFRGTLRPTVSWQGSLVTGEAFPLELFIAPTKQVVYLRFLPAFTDSLRLFGLRNLSAAVLDRIVSVVQRDYAGLNLELRLEEPEDFEAYALVEIGGADPNRQQLFGLDNTTGLDDCNQRLDDQLAGRNADSGGIYGGIFVESFLQFSARRGGPLGEALFDEIFDPVMERPALASELVEGARRVEIQRAIDALGSLVGNTLSHEIGHSLGLSRAVNGCGPYHNAAGPRQLMDCGQDRPFIERAGLDPEGPAIWTPENLSYLQQILPL